jgi:ankyrin repeat protein
MSSLHYAAMCGHSDVAALLVKRGADRALKDEDDNTPKDVADTPEVKALL